MTTRRAGPTVLWDFDGTLARRSWNESLLKILDADHEGHPLTPALLRPALAHGFPWHDHHSPHPHLSDPTAWWQNMTAILTRALVTAGLDEGVARAVSVKFRDEYLDVAGWQVYEDAIPALSRLRQAGWRHVILSNHVPELGVLVDSLGLAELIDLTITSAATGFEKPHPEAFHTARAAAGDPALIWMVGDNPVADVAGAEAVGIPAVLVRSSDRRGSSLLDRQAADLMGAAQIIEAGRRPGAE